MTRASSSVTRAGMWRRDGARRGTISSQSPRPPSLRLRSAQLPRDRQVRDRGVVDEHEGLAEDDRELLVALEREVDIVAAGRAIGNDAEVLVVRLHQDVAAAEVDL